jgi:hypothetical protein
MDKVEQDHIQSYIASLTDSNKMGRKLPKPWNEKTCANAADMGHFHVLKWAHEHGHGYPWDEETFSHAVSWGNLRVLEWLYNERCPWNEEIILAADSDMKIVQWLHERNCPLDAELLRYPVQTGDRETLKWLQENNCPSNWSSTCQLAACDETFDLMFWLYEQGHELTAEVYSKAAKYATIEILE